MTPEIKKKALIPVYIMVIFYALHATIPYFIFSKFLSEYFSTSYITLIFVLAGTFSIVASNYLGTLLKKYKDYKTLLFLSILQIFITIAIPIFANINLWMMIIFFLLNISITSMIWSCINIFLEEFSPTDNIGVIRGLSLTIYNFGVILSPFLAANVFTKFNYLGVFVLSALSMLPIIFFSKKYLSHIKEPSFKHKDFFKALKNIQNNNDLKGLFISSFILNAFYAASNLYLALYLLNEIKVPVNVYLGIITPIFLLPFILIPYELGKISDEYLGEKKMMIFGIFLFSMVLISIFLFNIKSENILLWIIILLISRIGATMTETENYTYFYKKINAENADIIAIFHNMINVSMIFVSLLGFIFINIFNISIPALLFIIGLIGLFSILKILKIHDILPKNKIN